MTTYIPLGSRQAFGQPDATGVNTGNWTVSFTPDIITSQLPYIEVWHIRVSGAPGSTFQVNIEANEFDGNLLGELNSWDASQPMVLRAGESLYFFYSNPDTDGNPPSVTIWLRYDQDIIANQRAMAQGLR